MSIWPATVIQKKKQVCMHNTAYHEVGYEFMKVLNVFRIVAMKKPSSPKVKKRKRSVEAETNETHLAKEDNDKVCMPALSALDHAQCVE